MNNKVVLQNDKVKPKLRVLDLASHGLYALRAYSERFPSGSVSLKAITIEPETLFNRFHRIDVGKAQKNVDFIRAKAALPECLKDEPSNYYDHVHFHMLTSSDKVAGKYTAMDEQKTIAMINEISRIMKGNGLFFMSADHLFEIDFEKAVTHEAQMNRLHSFVSSAFNVIGYAITERNSHYCIVSALQPEFKNVLSLFNLDEQPVDLPLDYSMLRLYQFISHFSEDSDSAEYLVVGRKTPARQLETY